MCVCINVNHFFPLYIFKVFLNQYRIGEVRTCWIPYYGSNKRQIKLIIHIIDIDYIV